MNSIDPTIEYARVIQTDGHCWKLYEVHRSHVKKTKFFRPRSSLRRAQSGKVMFTDQARFFDDYEHMLSVIGMLRFAMGISENIVQASEVYEIEELSPEKDPQRTIQKSLLSKQDSGTTRINDIDVKYITSKHRSVVQNVQHDRVRIDGEDDQAKIGEGQQAKKIE